MILFPFSFVFCFVSFFCTMQESRAFCAPMTKGVTKEPKTRVHIHKVTQENVPNDHARIILVAIEVAWVKCGANRARRETRRITMLKLTKITPKIRRPFSPVARMTGDERWQHARPVKHIRLTYIGRNRERSQRNYSHKTLLFGFRARLNWICGEFRFLFLWGFCLMVSTTTRKMCKGTGQNANKRATRKESP